MGQSVYVRVMGFGTAEREAIQAMFDGSANRAIAYAWWTDECAPNPEIVLLDGQMDVTASARIWASVAPGVKVLCVGNSPEPRAFRTLARPLHWPDLVAVMDQLVTPRSQPPARRVRGKAALVVDPSKEDRFYLRARLALAGHTDVDDAENAAQTLSMVKSRYYDLLIVSLDVPDMVGWELVRQLIAQEPAVGPVVVTSRDKSWQMREFAETAGCRAVLLKPFEPLQFQKMLQML